MKKKIISMVAIMALMSSVGVFATENVQPANSKATGTDRYWSADLPHNYGNVYFTPRDKETNETKGEVTATELTGSGIEAWFNLNGNGAIISGITTVPSLNIAYPVRYTSNSASGNVVYLGIENSDKTTWFQDTASGTVNYK